MMKYFFGAAIIALLFSCNNEPDVKLDDGHIMQFFSAYNWQVTQDNDTSYIFFSPVNDSLIYTYEYRMAYGDSVDTRINAIKTDGDHIVWLFKDKKLQLQKLGDSVLKFTSGDNSYELKKIGAESMQLTGPQAVYDLQRTLPLSTFLIRKKYDYSHMTNLSDSGEVVPKPKQKKSGKTFE